MGAAQRVSYVGTLSVSVSIGQDCHEKSGPRLDYPLRLVLLDIKQFGVWLMPCTHH